MLYVCNVPSMAVGSVTDTIAFLSLLVRIVSTLFCIAWMVEFFGSWPYESLQASLPKPEAGTYFIYPTSRTV
jgi:hypothetical protein